MKVSAKVVQTSMSMDNTFLTSCLFVCLFVCNWGDLSSLPCSSFREEALRGSLRREPHASRPQWGSHDRYLYKALVLGYVFAHTSTEICNRSTDPSVRNILTVEVRNGHKLYRWIAIGSSCGDFTIWSSTLEVPLCISQMAQQAICVRF